MALAERVLVTGGAGFIGRAVTRELLRRNKEVRVLDSLIEQVHGDRERPEDLANEAELIVGGVVSTVKERVLLYDDGSDELSTLRARQ